MNFENWISIIYEPQTNTKKKKKAKWSNFNSIEPNIAKWLYYIHQIQKKKTMKNKNYQFLNFLSNQTDFEFEKRNRECVVKKGKKIKKIKKPNNAPILRVLLDPKSPLNFTAFDNHIQIKLILLILADHPIISSFDSILNFSQGLENASFNASKPLEMDSGELSFNAFVIDINKIGMSLVAEKVRETEIRKLESNFV